MKSRKNNILFILISFFILFPNKTFAQNPRILYNDNPLILKDKIFINKGRTYLSLSDIKELFDLDYTKENNNIFLIKDTIHIQINDKTVFCDGIHFGQLKNEQVIILNDNSTYIPLRYITNALHKDINYNNVENTISISNINNKIIYPLLLTSENNKLIQNENPIYYFNNHYIFYTNTNENKSLLNYSKFPNNNYSKSSDLLNNNIFIMHPERGYIVGGIED